MPERRGTRGWARGVAIAAFATGSLCYLALLLLCALSLGILLCCVVSSTAIILRKPLRAFTGGAYAPT